MSGGAESLAWGSSWKISLRNLGRNRRRNLATGAAIAFGFSGLVLLAGHILRSEKYFRMNAVYLNHGGDVSVYKNGGLENTFSKPKRQSLSKTEQESVATLLAGDDRVDFLGHYLRGVGLLSNGCRSTPFFAIGAEPEIEGKIRNHPLVRRWAGELAVLKKGQGFWEAGLPPESIDVTEGLARLAWKPLVYSEVSHAPVQNVSPPLDCNTPNAKGLVRADSNVQLAAKNYDGDFSAADGEIAGHYSTGLAFTDDNSLMAPLSLLQQLYGTDTATYMAVYLKDGVNHRKFLKELQSKMDGAGLDLKAYPFDDEQISLFYVGVMGFFKTMAAFFVFLVFSVVALMISNSVTMAVIERTREIGTLRSMGFLPMQITGFFMRENLALTAMALVAGAAIAGLACFGISMGHFRYRPPGVAGDLELAPLMSVEVCLIFGLIILLIAMLATWITARDRTGRPVVELLTSTSG